MSDPIRTRASWSANCSFYHKGCNRTRDKSRVGQKVFDIDEAIHWFETLRPKSLCDRCDLAWDESTTMLISPASVIVNVENLAFVCPNGHRSYITEPKTFSLTGDQSVADAMTEADTNNVKTETTLKDLYANAQLRCSTVGCDAITSLADDQSFETKPSAE
uniref:Uncharacterized protein n=1 Tax=Kwoniella pini CBS 10737 TaxID=1296096 RepID=A0A1B9HVV4_9TREE|nr:uncharacterized protein I206_06292 [Kwoniella pini CBS 10737]OCF47396.1 hypothetical protein I206_06292 [Kwoniella pini CBS 10737]